MISKQEIISKIVRGKVLSYDENNSLSIRKDINEIVEELLLKKKYDVVEQGNINERLSWYHLAENPNLSEDIIRRCIENNKIDWQGLLTCYTKITEEFIEKYKDLENFKWLDLSLNPNFVDNFELLEKYKEDINWSSVLFGTLKKENAKEIIGKYWNYIIQDKNACHYAIIFYDLTKEQYNDIMKHYPKKKKIIDYTATMKGVILNGR